MNSGPECVKLLPHVTIVEDEADIAGLLAHCFACEGFQVTTARDGNAGLEVIRAGADGYLVKGGQVEPTLPPIRVFRHPAQGILGEFLQRRARAA